MIYSIGHNIAGYRPDTDPTWFADRDQAAAQLVVLMREYADGDDVSTWEALPGDPEEARAHGYAVTDDGIDYGDDWPSMLATVTSILTDDGPDACNGPWSAYAEDGRERRIVFWLHAEDFDPEYTLVTPEDDRVEVEKVGGGTVGTAYTGTWRYVAHDSMDYLLGCGNDFHTGTPMTHRQAARAILDIVLKSDD
jgi:hypothetical protein